MKLPYRNRMEGGWALATLLGEFANRADVLVLGLPRGGVPVAYAVAAALRAPLDVFLVRKLGVPGREELAMGAIASGGTRVLHRGVLLQCGIAPEAVERVAAREWQELARRERLYRGGRPAPEVAGRIIILVDDGLATGSTMRAAAAALRHRDPQRIVAAVPVAAPSTCGEMSWEVDAMVCAATPDPFQAVGLWYQDFAATTDQEVRELLEHTWQRWPAGIFDATGEATSDHHAR